MSTSMSTTESASLSTPPPPEAGHHVMVCRMEAGVYVRVAQWDMLDVPVASVAGPEDLRLAKAVVQRLAKHLRGAAVDAMGKPDEHQSARGAASRMTEAICHAAEKWPMLYSDEMLNAMGERRKTRLTVLSRANEGMPSLEEMYPGFQLEEQTWELAYAWDLTEDDARAEGCEPVQIFDKRAPEQGWISRIEGFRQLWNKAHGAGAWENNPLVWVHTFQHRAKEVAL